jgi:aminoglycoside phosphotransferase (APT) family kinase protein
VAALAERVRRATAASSVQLEQRLQALWSGYGELWRATLELGGSAVPVIVKDVRPPRDDASRSHRRKLRSYEVEQTFYARYAARCGDGCRVPRALALGAEQGGFLSVLEDLDAADFAGRCRRASADDIVATLRWLATFHATFLGVAPHGLWKVGTYWHLATRPDELQRMKHPALRQAASAIDARLGSARFKTLVHGDAKLENVCFARSRSAVALVDFQYVGGGVGVKDVAYFLSSCLSAHECRALVPGYLDRYFAELRAALATTSPDGELDELEREWRSLFPLAWVDLYRFLLGWAPGQYDPDPYSDALVSEVLGSLRSP